VGKNDDGVFASFPVCKKCHENPMHRARTLKMHFFERKMAKLAVAMAGSDTIVG
jgi:hypothetical protein